MAVLRQNERTGRNSAGLKRSNSFASFQPRPSGQQVTDRLYRDATDRLERGFFATEHHRSTMTSVKNSSSAS